jgi:hypothetical protein
LPRRPADCTAAVQWSIAADDTMQFSWMVRASNNLAVSCAMIH